MVDIFGHLHPEVFPSTVPPRRPTKYVQVHVDTAVLSGSSVRTWRDLGASCGLSGLEPIESTKIGPSCKA
jgi:hypothetical protein